MSDRLIIRTFRENDWPDVAHIYGQGIKTGTATFETEVPDFTNWDHSHKKEGRLVALVENSLVGWAALSLVSSRQVYSGVVEVSIYVAESWRRKGIGKDTFKRIDQFI